MFCQVVHSCSPPIFGIRTTLPRILGLLCTIIHSHRQQITGQSAKPSAVDKCQIVEGRRLSSQTIIVGMVILKHFESARRRKTISSIQIVFLQ